MIERFPLSWPAGWPRAKSTERSAFDRDRSLVDATSSLMTELRRLHATKVVLSTNVELRRDGLPYSGRRQPDDRGAAVYFTLFRVGQSTPVALACDRWDRVEDNIYALAKHIEALRRQQRWGVGTVEQAFAGFKALPPPSGLPTTTTTTTTGRTWRDVLGFAAAAQPHPAVIEDAHLRRARLVHPDVDGGDHDAMAELNAARDRALTEAARWS
jgi:hypothetical protein